MKNKEDIEVCMNIIYNNFDEINSYYKELLISSKVYPFLDFEVVS